MPILRVAARYAKAWFELAKEANVLDKAYDDAQSIRQMCKLEDFDDFIKNPLLSSDKKVDVLEKLLVGKAAPISVKVLKSIAQHGRTQYLRDICRSFRTLYYNEKHISKATLTTAVPITDKAAQAIIREFQSSGMLQPKVELKCLTDASIVGGFILEFNNQVYDASVALQLDQMRNQFSENLYTKTF